MVSADACIVVAAEDSSLTMPVTLASRRSASPVTVARLVASAGASTNCCSRRIRSVSLMLVIEQRDLDAEVAGGKLAHPVGDQGERAADAACDEVDQSAGDQHQKAG